MRKNLKKLVASMLVMSMIPLFATGCGKSGETEATVAAATTAAGSTNSTSSADATEAAPADVEVTPIKITFPGDRPADTDILIAEIEKAAAEDGIYVDLEFVFYPNADIDNTTRLSLASGENNDLIWSAGRADMMGYISAGYLLEFGDLLEEYAPNVIAMRPQEMWNNAKVGDGVYSIPMGVYNRSGRHFNIRADLRKELGLEPINSMEGLLEFAYLVQENYPEIPVIVPGSYGGEQYTSWATFQLSGFAPEYIDRTFISPSSLIFYLKNNDGIVYNLFDTYEPTIMEKIAEARELYNDGILYSDLLSLQTYRGTISEGKAAIVPWPEIIPEASLRNTLAANVPGAEIESVVWYEEDYVFQQDMMMADFKAWNHLSIAKVCKNPEKVLEFLNWTQIKENYDLCAYGIPGVHCNLVGEDRFENISANLRNFGYAWIWSPYLDRIDVNATDSEYEIELWLREGDPSDFVSNVAGPLIFDPTNVANELAQYLALEGEYYAPIFNGVVDTDEYMAKFKEEAYDLSKVLQEEYQRQLDAVLK